MVEKRLNLTSRPLPGVLVGNRATQVTDANGGTWAIGTPTASGSSAQYRGAVLSTLPRNSWSLGEASGTQAANLMTGNVHGNGYDAIGSDGYASYHNVSLGQPGMFAGAADTAAGFNGASSWVALPQSAYGNFGLWFKTSTPGGVLLGCQSQAPGTSGTPADAHPILYVGNDGKLYGEQWDGYPTPISSPSAVADGKWHFAAVIWDSSAEPWVETLYLDGVPVGTRSKDSGGCDGADTDYVGAGYTTSAWPSAPTNPQGYFTGSIANVTNFGYVTPNAATITALYDASHAAAASTTPFTTVAVTDPGSATLKSLYDPCTVPELDAAAVT